MANLPGAIRGERRRGRGDSFASLLGVQHLPSAGSYFLRNGELPEL